MQNEFRPVILILIIEILAMKIEKFIVREYDLSKTASEKLETGHIQTLTTSHEFHTLDRSSHVIFFYTSISQIPTRKTVERSEENQHDFSGEVCLNFDMHQAHAERQLPAFG